MSTQETLQALYDEHGILTPELVLSAASDPAHVLHSRFEWDDTEAARRYRLAQASGLIRSVTIVIEKPEARTVAVRAFISDREMGTQRANEDDELISGTYRPVAEVIASDVLRTAWFRALTRDWQALKRRAGQSREFADMVLDDLRGDTA